MAWATREKVVVNPARRKSFGRSRPKARKPHRPAARRNTGEQYSWLLNPGPRSGGKGKMAKKTKHRRNWTRHHHTAGARTRGNDPGRRRRRARVNPVRRHYRPNRRYARRNPAGFSFGQLFETGIFATVGAVGSKLLTQLVLGSSNTGILGYAGNVVAGALIGIAADKGLKNKTAAFAVYVGTAVQLVLRLITDFTPYGQAVALTGVGDYQVSNFLAPQRYVDALHGAMVQVPSGWGPGAPVAIQSAAVPADHAAGMSGSIYGGGGSIYE